MRPTRKNKRKRPKASASLIAAIRVLIDENLALRGEVAMLKKKLKARNSGPKAEPHDPRQMHLEDYVEHEKSHLSVVYRNTKGSGRDANSVPDDEAPTSGRGVLGFPKAS